MMNALKFLAVDRSLDSGKDFVGRFQMREPGMLPVLTEKRSVVAANQTEAGASRRSMWRRFVGWIGRAKPAGQTAAGASVQIQSELQKFRKTEADEPKPVVEVSEPSAEAGSRFAALASYNPFNRADKKVVQAEFRFENVRVVCNELHDTDFIIKT